MALNAQFVCHRCIRRFSRQPQVLRAGIRANHVGRTTFQRSLSTTPKPKQHEIKSKKTTTPSQPKSNQKISPNPHDFNWYWETFPPTFQQKAQASTFFTQQSTSKFLRSVALFRNFPDSDVPEVAFVGRSNVGKSSLLNAIVDTNLLARTSSTRGFTKTMNIYGVSPKSGHGINITKTLETGYEKVTGMGSLSIIDMPGYGDSSLSEWGTEILKYLQNRKQLRRVFVLIDASHGIKEKDQALLSSLRLSGITHQIVLSKLDKIYLPPSPMGYKSAQGKTLGKLKAKGSMEQLRRTMEAIKAQIQPEREAGALGELLGCSSEILVGGKRLGVDAVRFAILQAAGIRLGANSSKSETLVMDDSMAADSDKNPASISTTKPENRESTIESTQSVESIPQPVVKTYVNMPLRILPSPSESRPRESDAGEKLLLASSLQERSGRRRIVRPRRRVEGVSQSAEGSDVSGVPSSEPRVSDEGERLLMASMERRGGRRR